MTVKVNLKKLLKKEDTSLYKLCKDTGLSYQQGHAIANGRTKRIDFETIDLLCGYLDCEISDLIQIKTSKQLEEAAKAFPKIDRANFEKVLKSGKTKKDALEELDYKELLKIEKDTKRNGMHSFHRYFGKLIPAIPSFAIKTFTKEGDAILDSFCGSGTSILEAKMLNRDAYGVDLNPLAAFVANVKTTKISEKKIDEAWNKLKENINRDKRDYSKVEEPYCVNMDHWFKDFVKTDLLKVKANILNSTKGDVQKFFLGCFSAFLRGVSNADPRHVFPGYSKRLRKLDAEGKRKIEVLDSFSRAVRKRIKYLGTLPSNKSTIKVFTGDSRTLPREVKNVQLVVSNPPYISSIRYLETMKLEMGWLGFIAGQKEYLDLDKQGVGTERFYKEELQDLESTKLTKLDKQIKKLKQKGNAKMAKVVSEYFVDMRKSFSEMNRVLKKGGYIVIKISDSTVRGELISTHKHFIDIAEDLQLKTLACFKDDFDSSSRSLLTKRNSYSGIMNHDWILIFQKKK